MVSGLSYTIESHISDLSEWMRTWIDTEWMQFDHVSEWEQDDDMIIMTTIIVRVRDISGVCCVKKG